MIGEGSPVYLRVDDESGERVLRPGIIAGMARDCWTIDFEVDDLLLEVGDERFIHFTQAKSFLQRPVRVEEVLESGPVARVVMKFAGSPTLADTRHEARVCAVDAGLAATLGSDDCAVHDISMSGLGVICGHEHPIGRPIDVTLRYKSDQFGGQMIVQYGLKIDSEQIRYGLRGIFEAGDGSPLRSGLTRTTLAIHREELGQTPNRA